MANNPGFSLGFAICGQEGHAHIPDAWRSQLLQQCMDANSRLAWFRSCRSGRDWVLQTAQKATLTWQLNVRPPQFTSTLAADVQALQTRGQHRTTVLALAGRDDDVSNLMLVPGALIGLTGQLVTHLLLDILHLHPPVTSRGFLTAAASALPQLRAVQLGQLNCPLPAPSLFPNLKSLAATVTCATEDLAAAAYASIGAYLPQLIHLGLGSVQPTHWPHVFSAATASTTLKQFSTYSELSDDLLSLLVQHTPALEQLMVSNITVQSDQWRDMVWGVQRVHCDRRSVTALCISRLPRNSNAETAFEMREIWLDMVDATGLPAAVLERLPTWRFPCLEDVVLNSPEEPWDDGVLAAISPSVQRLASLAVQGRTMWFAGFPTTAHVLQVVTSAVAAHTPHTALGLVVNILDDELAVVLLQHAPSVTHLEMARLALTRALEQPCRWTVLLSEQPVDLVQLLHVTQPAGASLTIKMLKPQGQALVLLSPEQVSDGLHDRLKAKLQNVSFANTPSAIPLVAVACPPGVPVTDEPALLRANLEVCRSMTAKEADWVVKLTGWTMVASVVAELRGLPEWGRVLDLSGCSWVAELGVCCDIAKVPEVYKQWRVQGASQHVVLDMVIGQVLQKTATGTARSVTLTAGDQPWVPEIKAYIERLGMQEHITVV